MERTLGIANTHPESCPRQAKVAGRGHDPEGRVELPPTRTVQATVSRRRRSYLILKRVADLLIAVVALLILWPLLVVIALLVKLDSAGPALFLQTRIGKDGRPFRVIKFRTMRHNVDNAAHKAFMRSFVRGEICPSQASNALYKPFDQAEVTRIGRILRRTSFDELPQLLNVLKGEMSLVGPRPNVPWEVAEYKEWHMERLAVLPGITGLAQVNGRSSIVFDTIVQYDIAYVRNQDPWLDLKILWRTFATVREPHGVM